MKVLELFAGSCSFSNVAKEFQYDTFTTDYKDFDGIDYVTDIFEFNLKRGCTCAYGPIVIHIPSQEVYQIKHQKSTGFAELPRSAAVCLCACCISRF